MPMFRAVRRILPAALTLLLAAAATAQTAPPQRDAATLAREEAAIKAARIAQTQAMAVDDLDKVVTWWAPEITIRRAMGQPVDGAAAARKLLEPPPNPSPNRLIYQREPVAVQVSPNWPLAYEEGRWSGHPGSVANAPVIGGRYAAQWVLRDGKWLIRSEVFVALTCSGAGCTFPAAP
jgi:ketosteroid isomerase-like protein